eukprot:CAMPEP_0114302476 /NCGR_PEP_ID=MMETSP0059-20121206/14678_1 /TAXON_ID=36894 /ORGANISM="Pyramimonas parkeae, Strain CCMP726" /LENGTH=314 /DNA_ID=CAMNT_0001425319 /DNA_START=106 /DNA_END=1050 /DNA_ORIENTATION=-
MEVSYSNSVSHALRTNCGFLQKLRSSPAASDPTRAYCLRRLSAAFGCSLNWVSVSGCRRLVSAQARRRDWDQEDDWGDYDSDSGGGRRGDRTGRGNKSSNGKKFKRRRGKAGAQLSEERTFSLDEYAATLQDQQNTLDSTQDIRTNYSRVLGVDLGKRRTGVAVSAGGLAPRALEVLTIKGMPLVEHLAGVVVEEKVQEVVVGIPTRSVGRSIDRAQNADKTGATLEEPKQAKYNRIFARRLATAVKDKGISVFVYDESYTSSEALEYLIATGSNWKQRRSQLDSYAAAALLVHYFKRSAGTPEKMKPFAGGLF